jgi:hypothetical protein
MTPTHHMSTGLLRPCLSMICCRHRWTGRSLPATECCSAARLGAERVWTESSLFACLSDLVGLKSVELVEYRLVIGLD